MASPAVRSSIVTNGTTASATPVVNLPATVVAGDTILVWFKSAAAGAIGWPGGGGVWNELVDASPDASVGQIALAWKKADGSEGGTTITLSATSGKFAAIAYAISGAEDPTVQPPQISTVATGTSAGQPDSTIVSPTGGSKDYLFGALYAMEGEQTGVTSYPSSYTLGQQFANSGTAGVVTTNATLGGAWRQATASSENSGAWTVAGTLDDWSAYTVAVHPATNITIALTNTNVVATGAVQALGVALAIGISGLASTGSVGSVSGGQPISGISSTASIGSPSTTRVVETSGVSSTASVGSLPGSVAISLSGVSSTGSAGTVTVSGGVQTDVWASGVWASGVWESGVWYEAAGGDVDEALTGVSSTASVGSLTVSVSRSITGNSATGAVGSVTAPASGDAVWAAGVWAAGVWQDGVWSEGAAGGDVDEALTGVSSTSGVGSLTSSRTLALAGTSATASIGSLTSNNAAALSTVSSTGAVGSLTSSQTIPLSTVSATGAVGTLSTSVGGNVTVGITTVSSTASVGSLNYTKSGSLALTTVSATTAVDSVTTSRTQPISTVSATGLVDSVTRSNTVALSQNATTTSVGSVVAEASSVIAITGVAATGGVGSVSPPGVYNPVARPGQQYRATLGASATGATIRSSSTGSTIREVV